MEEHLVATFLPLPLFQLSLLQNRRKTDTERVKNAVWKQTHIHTQDAHLDGASWVFIPCMVTVHEMHPLIHLHEKTGKETN
jgi:hypothetical protein